MMRKWKTRLLLKKKMTRMIKQIWVSINVLPHKHFCYLRMMNQVLRHSILVLVSNWSLFLPFWHISSRRYLCLWPLRIHVQPIWPYVIMILIYVQAPQYVHRNPSQSLIISRPFVSHFFRLIMYCERVLVGPWMQRMLGYFPLVGKNVIWLPKWR